MKNGMTRIALAVMLALGAQTSDSFATAVSPVVQGLGGAGRAGVAKESAFTNPASASLLKDASFFLFYAKPHVSAFDSGGRGYSIGASDGGTAIKGSFAFVSSSAARIGRDGQQIFEDRSEFRFATGFSLGGNVAGGIATRYVNRRNPGGGDNNQKFFQGDLGILFPLFWGVTGGVTYENVFNQEDERPPTIGAGLQYNIGGGLRAFADGTKIMNGTRKASTGWALAGDLTLGTDYTVRIGRFQDAYRKLRGWSFGLAWTGPRMTVDYALRMAGDNPKEQDHILGFTVRM
jgi:hypothetical protein